MPLRSKGNICIILYLAFYKTCWVRPGLCLSITFMMHIICVFHQNGFCVVIMFSPPGLFTQGYLYDFRFPLTHKTIGRDSCSKTFPFTEYKYLYFPGIHQGLFVFDDGWFCDGKDDIWRHLRMRRLWGRSSLNFYDSTWDESSLCWKRQRLAEQPSQNHPSSKTKSPCRHHSTATIPRYIPRVEYLRRLKCHGLVTTC